MRISYLIILIILLVTPLVSSNTNNIGISETSFSDEFPPFYEWIEAIPIFSDNQLKVKINFDQRMENLFSEFRFDLAGIHGEPINWMSEPIQIDMSGNYIVTSHIIPDWPRHIRVDTIYLTQKTTETIVSLEYGEDQFISEMTTVPTQWDNEVPDNTVPELNYVEADSTGSPTNPPVFLLNLIDSSGIITDFGSMNIEKKKKYQINAIFESDIGLTTEFNIISGKTNIDEVTTEIILEPTIGQYFGNSMKLSSLKIADRSGNIGTYLNGINITSPVVALSGTTPDNEAPVLESINYSTNSLSLYETLNVTINISDDVSGVNDNSIIIWFSFNNTNMRSSFSSIVNNGNGNYYTIYELNEQYTTGFVYVHSIEFEDNIGRRSYYEGGVNFTRQNITTNVGYDIEPPVIRDISYYGNIFDQELALNITVEATKSEPDVVLVNYHYEDINGEKIIQRTSSIVGDYNIGFFSSTNSSIILFNPLKTILENQAVGLVIDMIWLFDTADNSINYSNRTDIATVPEMITVPFDGVQIPITFPSELYEVVPDDNTSPNENTPPHETTIETAGTDIDFDFDLPYPFIGLIGLLVPLLLKKKKPFK